MDGITIYHALYKPDIVENTIKAKEKFINDTIKKLEEFSEVLKRLKNISIRRNRL